MNDHETVFFFTIRLPLQEKAIMIKGMRINMKVHLLAIQIHRSYLTEHLVPGPLDCKIRGEMLSKKKKKVVYLFVS